MLALPHCKAQIFWGGSGSLSVSSHSLDQRGRRKGGPEIWWHNRATRELGVRPHFMLSRIDLLKKAPGLGLLPGTVFRGTWQQSDEAGQGEDRNHELVKQRTGRFQARDCWDDRSTFTHMHWDIVTFIKEYSFTFSIQVCNKKKSVSEMSVLFLSLVTLAVLFPPNNKNVNNLLS